MYTVQTRNAISSHGLAVFEQRGISVDTDVDNPDALLVRSAKLNDETFPSSVKAIGRAGAGYNNVPVARCTEQGIVVFNTPGANANSVKELVITALMLSSRRISEGIAWVRSAAADDTAGLAALVEKEKKRFVGPEIRGKTLGVIGLGAIGVMVSNAASSLGMKVIGYDPYISVNSAWDLDGAVGRAGSLAEIYNRADYISIHAPLTDTTRGMIDEAAVAQLKHGVRIINMARGELVDNGAMKVGLDRGIVSCYVTDFPSDSLAIHEGVIPVPHLGASTPEAEDNCAVMAAEQLSDFLQFGNIRNSVNFPACEMPIGDGARLLIANRNIPNMVGQITGILASRNANIADMLNKHREKIAYNIIDLEGDVSTETLALLEAIEGVISVRKVTSRQG
ncbi:MAG: 3-phosphoglycerate dehydrogenase [Spirochaetaceae bacterium]|nr:MAG: 3-phosphoglycerate dehydrogenase [Spirochaetaceae bacterium]